MLNILKEIDVHEWIEQEITYQVKHGGGFSPNSDSWYGKEPSEPQRATQLSRNFQDIFQENQEKYQNASKTLESYHVQILKCCFSTKPTFYSRNVWMIFSRLGGY